MGKSLNGKELGKGISQRKEDAINELKTDNERKNSKKILVDMLEKAMATDLVTKNVVKQITTDF